MKKLFLSILIIAGTHFLKAQTPCEDGMAGQYPCDQIDLQSHMSIADLWGDNTVELNDIWGWTDPESGKEYALVGVSKGVVFVDVSDPINPINIGKLPTHASQSVWRDIKAYNNYAFVVADNNSGHGMQIFDLTRLRNYEGTPLVFDNDAHYDGISSAHNVVINEETGFAYIVGARGAATCGVGGLHIVDINDPLNPTYAGCFDSDGYTHDAQCVIYNGPDADYTGQEICFNANENTVTIANVNDKSQTSLISKEGYSKSEYAHQCWLTEDHQFLISNDELDEARGGLMTRTLIWDVRDLDNPVLIGQYYSDRTSIDHNLYVNEGLIYQSNYESGLIVFGTDSIASGEIRELAFFDTYYQSTNTSFNGAWSNYPFFESGNIIASDINNGLFVLKPSISSSMSSHPVLNGFELPQTLTVGVETEANVQEYQWQELTSSGFQDITAGNNYSGENTSALTLNEGGNFAGKLFRCKVIFNDGSQDISYATEPFEQDGLTVANKSEVTVLDQVWPNPVRSRVTVKSEKLIERIKVMNIKGETLIEQAPSSASGELIINLEEVSKGVLYLMVYHLDGSWGIKKLVKE
jgi:choice-of-anchor B domain-containing protein